MENPPITLRNVSKAYKLYQAPRDRLKEALHPFGKKYHDDFFAIKELSLSVNRGEMLGVLGKNGSGKSTLLKLIARVLIPSSGTIDVHGTISALLELGAGFNPQFTGLQNIYFYGTILGFTREQMDAKLESILEFADIGDFIHQPIKMYSSGMRARLSFAVATEIDPDILIIDEVLAVGDMRFASKCLRRMHEIKDKKKTVIFVTHDVSKVAVFCDRAVWLKDGQIAAIGNAKEISEQFRDYMLMGMVAESKEQKKAQEDVKEQNQAQPTQEPISGFDRVQWVDLKGLPTIRKRQIRVIRVAVCKSDNNQPATVIERGEHVKIYLLVTSTEDIENVSVGFVLTDKQGLIALHVNNEFCQKKIGKIDSGKQYICCFDLCVPPLQNGEYMFAFGLKENDDVIFKVNDVIPIEIMSSDIFSLQAGYVIAENVEFRMTIDK